MGSLKQKNMNQKHGCSENAEDANMIRQYGYKVTYGNNKMDIRNSCWYSIFLHFNSNSE